MPEHNIFYYPYASFGDQQSLLLKTVALYFDKLYILDPSKANWGKIGKSPLEHDMRLLEQEKILVRVSPEDVLHKYELAIAEAIRSDMQDREFLDVCEHSGRAGRWTLALAKVPQEIQDDPKYRLQDRSMQRLMGDVAREVSSELEHYVERYAAEKAKSEVYDEYRETGAGVVEYRYADYPLQIGESIMINHALFSGLMYKGATPLTDDPFHNKVLHLKMQRARQIPGVREILEDRAMKHQLKRDQLAMAALTDIEFPIISPKMSLEAILEYRRDHKHELQQARKELGLLARQIKKEPWSNDFLDHIDSETIPNIQKILEKNKTAREDWLKSSKGKKWLRLAGLAASAAGTILSIAVSATPLMPVGIAITALGLTSSVGILGVELALDWKEGKKEAMGNGLHYFMAINQ